MIIGIELKSPHVRLPRLISEGAERRSAILVLRWAREGDVPRRAQVQGETDGGTPLGRRRPRRPRPRDRPDLPPAAASRPQPRAGAEHPGAAGAAAAGGGGG